MKILLVGGSGNVGTCIIPYLRQQYEIRVLDVRPPPHADVEFVEGSIADPHALERALHGVDSFVAMVMKSPQDGSVTDQTPSSIADNYSINALGLHLLLHTAHQAGIRRGVYTSSASVHDRERDYFPSEEQVPLDGPSVYGLTKGFGELICAYFCRWFDMNIVALRLSGPSSRQHYLEYRRNPELRPNGHPYLYVTDEEDLARAYSAALRVVEKGHGRFEAIYVTGDETGQEWNLSKAEWLLGWHPESQRFVDAPR
ncbi:MAG: NAD(P)-dependent oxidoreductase [Chloroflexi bacterium]|nr:NAD(P)-dependent oxidoreductase [Chloroflexota bacterium]